MRLARSRGTPAPRSIKFCHEKVGKTRYLEAAHGENFLTIACMVLTQYSSVTDRRTDG